MNTQKEQQWAGTLKYTWHDDRRILLSTIALSKSDAITALLNDWPEVHEGCKSRRSKWKKMKADERQFKVVPITISVDGEDEVVESKRCCKNCIKLQQFEVDDEPRIDCAGKNMPAGECTVDQKVFLCRYHKYYHEVFPDG